MMAISTFPRKADCPLAKPTPQAGARRLLEPRVDNLEAVASGANLVQMLRQFYERVRLDLLGTGMPATEVLALICFRSWETL